MGLFTPAWKTNDPKKLSKAIEAVGKTTDEGELRRIALEAPHPDVRMSAVYMMRSPALLKEMAFSRDMATSAGAVNNINDVSTLTEVACGTGAAAGRAVMKIADQGTLAAIVQNAASPDAREQAGKQLDYLSKIYGIAEMAGLGVNQATSQGTISEMVSRSNYRQDQTDGIVAAIVSEAKDIEAIGRIVETCASWGGAMAKTLQSARLRKIELLGANLANSQSLVMRCKNCGGLVRYVGYFDSVLRDSWEEKGDYTCGCTEHPGSTAGFPEEPAWEVAVVDEPIEGDAFRLCPICMKPNGMDVNIKPLSRCINLDPDTSKDRLKHITAKYQGVYIPWTRAVW